MSKGIYCSSSISIFFTTLRQNNKGFIVILLTKLIGDFYLLFTLITIHNCTVT